MIEEEDELLQQWAAGVVTAQPELLVASPPPLPIPKTREQRRSGRKRAIRARTENLLRGNKTRLRILGQEYAEVPGVDYLRPKTRGECVDGDRPCPFVSCQHHLYLDVSSNGSIKLNFPDLEVWELPESCVLDVADRGGATLEQVGVFMNITRERVRQIEVKAKRKSKRKDKQSGGALASYADVGRVVVRGLLVDDDEDASMGGEEDGGVDAA